jgi:hypothetical protein
VLPCLLVQDASTAQVMDGLGQNVADLVRRATEAVLSAI